MKLTKSKLREIIREEIQRLNETGIINETKYNFGKVEYTKKRLSPTEILDLAKAYIDTPISKLAGRSHGGMVVVANDIANLNGRIQHLPDQKSKSPALLHQTLKSGLITKDEYVKLWKALIHRHKEFVKKYLNNSDYSQRFAGRYGSSSSAAHTAQDDMAGEFDFKF